MAQGVGIASVWCRCVALFSLLLFAQGTLIAVAAEEIVFGRPEQGSAWELPVQKPPSDPFSVEMEVNSIGNHNTSRVMKFSVGCGEENRSYKGSSLEPDLKILPKGEPPVKKEPLCTVNCFRADPVCGSDGVTYWCGVAEAKCAEVEVAHEGYCDIWNSGMGPNLGLHAAQSLQLVHMVWLVLAGLLIVIGLP